MAKRVKLAGKSRVQRRAPRLYVRRADVDQALRDEVASSITPLVVEVSNLRAALGELINSTSAMNVRSIELIDRMAKKLRLRRRRA